MGSRNAFPLDLPDVNDETTFVDWQQRMVERLEFTISRGLTDGSASATTIVSLALDPLTVYFVESWIMGVLAETSGSLIPGQAMLNIWRGGFKLDGSNVAQIVGGSADKAHSSANYGETSEPWTTNLTTDGANIVQTVTGTAIDLIRWRCKMKIFKVGI